MGYRLGFKPRPQESQSCVLVINTTRNNARDGDCTHVSWLATKYSATKLLSQMRELGLEPKPHRWKRWMLTAHTIHADSIKGSISMS